MITLEPIGLVHTPYHRFYDTPRQPGVDALVDESYVELFSGNNYEQALEDLAECERIWLVVYFHLATSWKPKVLPPRGRVKRGVFSTRSPHRPNPIGITCCELLSIQGRRIAVRGTDLIDATPVLDIKPYLPYADAFPNSSVGWVDSLREQEYQVSEDGLHLLPEDVQQVVLRTLRHDPLPHPYRRIQRIDEYTYELAVREYRITYAVRGLHVSILQTNVVL